MEYLGTPWHLSRFRKEMAKMLELVKGENFCRLCGGVLQKTNTAHNLSFAQASGPLEAYSVLYEKLFSWATCNWPFLPKDGVVAQSVQILLSGSQTLRSKLKIFRQTKCRCNPALSWHQEGIGKRLPKAKFPPYRLRFIV